MNENEYYEEEGRYYANPQLGLDETSQFLESFEAARQRENDRIAQETHALGTDVPSSMGGLSGSGGVWRQRYQNPQVAKMISDLDAEMQAQALTTAMSNDLSKWQNRYSQAKRNYNKRKAASTTPSATDPGLFHDGEVETKANDEQAEVTGVLSGVAGSKTIVNPMTGQVMNFDIDTDEMTGSYYPNAQTYRVPTEQDTQALNEAYRTTGKQLKGFSEGARQWRIGSNDGKWYYLDPKDNQYKLAE